MWTFKALPIQGNPRGPCARKSHDPTQTQGVVGGSGHLSVCLPTQIELRTDTQINYHAELQLEGAGVSWQLLLQSTISANN